MGRKQLAAIVKTGHPGRGPRRREAGLSLIEVMIAIAVVAVGLLGIAAIQLKALRGGQAGRVFTQASELAYERLEQLRAVSFTSLTATGGWTSPTTQSAQVRNDQGSAVVTQTFQRSERIAGTGTVRNIDVRVQWTNQNADAVLQGQRQIVISTARYQVAPTSGG